MLAGNHLGEVLPPLNNLSILILLSSHPFIWPKAHHVKHPFVALLVRVLGGGVLLLLLLVLDGSAGQLILVHED